MAVEERSARSGNGVRYGILGGTFDPPHVAHLVVAQEARARLGLQRVYFVPAGQPPHKLGHPITPATDRWAMVQRAIADEPGFALSAVEVERDGPSYTVETLRLLRAAWGPEPALYLIVGWDMLFDLPRWHDPAGVVAEATHVVAAHRPGYQADPAQMRRLEAAVPQLASKLVMLPVPQLEISASEVRQRVASSLPLRYLVPDTVIEYIVDHGLYHSADNAESGYAAPAEHAPDREDQL